MGQRNVVKVESIDRSTIYMRWIVEACERSDRTLPFRNRMVQQWLATEHRNLGGHLLSGGCRFQHQTYFVRNCCAVWFQITHHSVPAVNMKNELILASGQGVAKYFGNGLFDSLPDPRQPAIKSPDDKGIADTADDDGLVSNQLSTLELDGVCIGRN